MAYKDEYEVARLYTDGRFHAALREEFEVTGKLQVHLAPPLFAGKDPATGLPRKIAFSPWIFPVFKRWRLRGFSAKVRSICSAEAPNGGSNDHCAARTWPRSPDYQNASALPMCNPSSWRRLRSKSGDSATSRLRAEQLLQRLQSL